MVSHEKVLTFWLEEVGSESWFKKDPQLDAQIREKFLALHTQAMAGELDSWKETAEGTLAFIILLDQFSRNMFRDTPQAFASDALAVQATKEAIQKGFDKQIEKGKMFFYMPLMHSEELEDQQQCLDIFNELAKGSEAYKQNAIYAEKHLVIIERFNRFPHRNDILGRESSEEEKHFLTQPGSSF